MSHSFLKWMLNDVTTTFVDYPSAEFPREIWSQTDNMEADMEMRIMRTNNLLEFFHGKLKKMIHRQPNIYRFPEMLHEEQQYQELNLRLLWAGSSTTDKQRSKYAIVNDKLQRLNKPLFDGEIMPYDYFDKCAAVIVSQKK